MIRTKFFNDPDGGYAKISSKRTFTQAWKRVLDYEKKTGLCLDDGFTREQYIDLLNSMKIRKTIMYKNFKFAVLYYVRYLIVNGILPAEQEEILSSIQLDDFTVSTDGPVQYYKDLTMLRDAVQDTVKSSMSYDETLYDSAAVIIYLAWYGLTEQEIVDFPKENVLDDGIVIRGEKRQIPFDILQVFKRLRDSDGYYQQARGVIFHTFVASDYLIRTERRDHITVELMQSTLSRFNAIRDKVYSLRYNVVYESGIFNRLYRMECDGFQFDLNDPAVASKVFCKDLSNKDRRLEQIRDYALYKKLYY